MGEAFFRAFVFQTLCKRHSLFAFLSLMAASILRFFIKTRRS
jgi:hypothetical protein